MPRLPTLTLGQWFRQLDFHDRPWVINAKCGKHQGLPWIADKKPDIYERLEMNQICSQCPVIASCAGYGLTAMGGFYAGHWIPWHTASPQTDVVRYERRRARDALRSIVKKASKGEQIYG